MNHPHEERVATRIVWTDQEWNNVTVALMALPGYNGALPDIIPKSDIERAMQVLPAARHRTIYPNVKAAYRPNLLAAQARIRDLLTGTLSTEPAATPPAPEPAPEPTPEVTGHRVFWKPEELDTLAREIYRMSPTANYHLSNALAGLSLKEVLDAQRNVLPPERRRALKQIVSLRPMLVEAFKRIRNQLAFEEAQKFLAKPAPEPTPEPEPQPEPVAEIRAPEPTPAPPAEESFNPHELALRVLVEMLVPSLAKALVPELAKLGLGAASTPAPLPAQASLAPSTAVVAQVAQTVERAPDAEHDPLEFQPPASYQPPAPTDLPAVLRAPEKPRLTKVAVLGLKPIQFQELRAAFPNLDIVTEQGHHSAKTLKSLQSAERVVVANNETNSMNGMTDKMLRSHFGDKYVRANGGMSMVKRQIQMWIHSGVLK